MAGRNVRTTIELNDASVSTGLLLTPPGRKNIQWSLTFDSEPDGPYYTVEIPQTSVRKEHSPEGQPFSSTTYVFDGGVEVLVPDDAMRPTISIYTKGARLIVTTTPETRPQIIRDLERIKSMIETEVATSRSTTARRAGRRRGHKSKTLKHTRRPIRK